MSDWPRLASFWGRFEAIKRMIFEDFENNASDRSLGESLSELFAFG
jgi:hypothetical protein